MNINICFVTMDNPYSKLRDGVAVSIHEFSNELKNSKSIGNIWIIGLDKNIKKDKITKKGEINYYRISCQYSSWLLRLITMIIKYPKIINKLGKQIDIYFGHGGYCIPIAIANTPNSIKVAKLQNSGKLEDKYIVKELISQKKYLDSTIRLLLPNFAINLIRKYYLSKMDGIVAVTDHVKNYAINEYNIKNIKTIYNTNYVKNTNFVKNNKEKKEKNRFIIAYFGRITFIKGIHILLRSIPTLMKSKAIESKDIEVDIYGDGAYKDKLIQLALELDIDNIVNFKGFMPKNELLKEIYNCDVVVLPSLSEGFPLTLSESLSLGKPIIASENVPVYREIINNNKCGLLSPPNKEEIAKNIQYLINNPELLEKLGYNAQNTFDNILQPNKIIDEYVNYFKYLIKNN